MIRLLFLVVLVELLGACTTPEQWGQALSTIEPFVAVTHSEDDGAFRVGKEFGTSSDGWQAGFSWRPFDAFHVQRVRVERISENALEPDPPPKRPAPANPNPLAFDGFDLVGPRSRLCDPDPVSLEGLNDPDPEKRP